jgi:hypothetical protein
MEAPGRAAGDRLDAEINTGGATTTVETHLGLAGGLAFRHGREVDKAQIYWLFDLKNLVVCQEDVGDMSLNELDALGRARVRALAP